MSPTTYNFRLTFNRAGNTVGRFGHVPILPTPITNPVKIPPPEPNSSPIPIPRDGVYQLPKFNDHDTLLISYAFYDNGKVSTDWTGEFSYMMAVDNDNPKKLSSANILSILGSQASNVVMLNIGPEEATPVTFTLPPNQNQMRVIILGSFKVYVPNIEHTVHNPLIVNWDPEFQVGPGTGEP
jgi:hypothetical protein